MNLHYFLLKSKFSTFGTKYAALIETPKSISESCKFIACSLNIDRNEGMANSITWSKNENKIDRLTTLFENFFKYEGIQVKTKNNSNNTIWVKTKVLAFDAIEKSEKSMPEFKS